MHMAVESKCCMYLFVVDAFGRNKKKKKSKNTQTNTETQKLQHFQMRNVNLSYQGPR